MKKLNKVIFGICLCLSLTSCNNSNGSIQKVESVGEKISNENKDKEQNLSKYNIDELINKITENANTPPSNVIKLDKTNFKQYSFIDWKDGMEGVSSESQINTQAHSVVLIKINSGDAEKIAKEISEKADVRKWICVEAEKSKVLYTDNYVLLIMSYQNSFDNLVSNFENIFGKNNVKSIDVKSSKNVE